MNTQRLNLDLAKRTGNQQVVIAQGDKAGTTIEATVYDSGTKLAETGVTAYFVMELPDGRHYARDTATYQNGVITYVVDESRVAAVAGYTDNAYFELHKGADIASTERFSVTVEPCAYSDHEPAEDWDNAIATLVERGAKAVMDANSAIEAANAAVSNANEAANAAALELEYDRQVLAGTYEGRDIREVLGALSEADAYAMLSAKATLKDGSLLRIGDYLDVTPTVTTINDGQPMRARLAGIGHNHGVGDVPCPWAFWFVFDGPISMPASASGFDGIRWNATNDNNGTAEERRPYLASALHAWELGTFLPALPTVLQDVLVDHRVELEVRYSASEKLTQPTNASWGDAGKVFSLSETEVFGQRVEGDWFFSQGADALLPLFRDGSRRVCGSGSSRASWWLRTPTVGLSTHVCAVRQYGTSRCFTASFYAYPRPCILIG